MTRYDAESLMCQVSVQSIRPPSGRADGGWEKLCRFSLKIMPIKFLTVPLNGSLPAWHVNGAIIGCCGAWLWPAFMQRGFRCTIQLARSLWELLLTIIALHPSRENQLPGCQRQEKGQGGEDFQENDRKHVWRTRGTSAVDIKWSTEQARSGAESIYTSQNVAMPRR